MYIGHLLGTTIGIKGAWHDVIISCQNLTQVTLRLTHLYLVLMSIHDCPKIGGISVAKPA